MNHPQTARFNAGIVECWQTGMLEKASAILDSACYHDAPVSPCRFMNMDACMVTTTFPDEDTAQRITAALLEGRLAGCIQTLPVSSAYRWQGEIQHDREILGLIKTTTERYPAVEALIRKLHPYECPEIICLPITAGLPDYLAWLQNVCE